MKRYLYLAACMAVVSLGACSSDSQFPDAKGKGNVRAINAISTSPPFSFLIEERTIGAVEYRTSTTTSSYDDLEYNFNFEVALPGTAALTRVASEFLDVVADKDYTFVIGGAIAAPTITLWEADVRVWEGDETAFEARFAHTAASLGSVDVYFAPAMDPPTPPVVGEEIGTLALGEILPAVELADGEYIITVTAAGDETAVLFQSDPVTPFTQTSIIVSLFDADANETALISVSAINASGGGTVRVADSISSPTVRFYHTSFNVGDVDIYTEDPLDTPKVPDHMFLDVTGDIEVPAGNLPLTYTTAGNMGSILLDLDRTVPAGTRSNYYLIENSAGEDTVVVTSLDRRSVETFAKFTIINTAANHPRVDVYVVPADDLIDEAFPIVSGLSLGGVPVFIPLLADSFDIYITESGEKTVIVGPVRLDTVGGDILETVIYDNVDPTSADLVFIPFP